MSSGDAEAQKSIGNFSMGDGVDKQQVGVVYAGDSIVSLSSSGALNILDARAQGVVNVLAGSQKAVTSAALVSPGSSTFLAGTADGRIVEYDSSAHVVKLVTGEPHGSLVSGITIDTSTGKGFSVGFDDKIKEIEGSSFV
jgi:WD40 repeat protein